MGIIILDQFISNFSILSTGLFIIHMLNRKHRVSPLSKISIRIWAGILRGLLGVVLLHFTIHIEKNVAFDFRIIPMMLAAQVGGWLSCGIATVIIIAARLLFYPFSTFSIVNTVLLFASGVCFGIISNLKIERMYKWTFMVTTFLLLSACTVGVVLHVVQDKIVIVQFAISIIVASYLSQILLSYLLKQEQDFYQFEEGSRTDFLTGLNNQRTFTQQFKSFYTRAKESNEPLSLLTIDIDHFKKINDTYGHQVGDQVLKHLSLLLTRTCRSVDIVSRNGGEEFSVIMPNCESIQAKNVAQRIRTKVENTPFANNTIKNISLTVSIGVATLKNNHSLQIEELIRMSDSALYNAKRSGRNQVCILN